jgi:protein-tyrosine phosphatase
MVDIHSHIIPGVDDGSPDLPTTLSMLRRAVESGTKSIIATPHYYRGFFANDYGKVTAFVDDLKRNANTEGIEIDIYPGQEVFLDRHTVEMYRNGIIRGLNGSRYLLVEMPMQDYSESFLDILYELRLLGAVPVIAHPERYEYMIDDINRVNPFIDEGCLFQVNAGSITGVFGRKVQNTARVLIESGLCNFVASDAHTNGRRSTGISDAFGEVRCISRAAAAAAKGNADQVLKDGAIEAVNGKIRVKKSIFSFLR